MAPWAHKIIPCIEVLRSGRIQRGCLTCEGGSFLIGSETEAHYELLGIFLAYITRMVATIQPGISWDLDCTREVTVVCKSSYMMLSSINIRTLQIARAVLYKPVVNYLYVFGCTIGNERYGNSHPLFVESMMPVNSVRCTHEHVHHGYGSLHRRDR